MIRQKPHTRAASWLLITYSVDAAAPIVVFFPTKEDAEERLHRVSTTFALRYAYIAEVKESFFAGVSHGKN